MNRGDGVERRGRAKGGRWVGEWKRARVVVGKREGGKQWEGGKRTN